MKNYGFSLIELLIAIAVVGLLAAIAYPSYTEYVERTRRAEAAGVLLEAMQVAERHFSQTGAYAGAPIPIASPTSGAAVYDIAMDTNVAGTGGLQITATAVAGGLMDGDACDEMSIDALGVKLPDDALCWRR